jgi:hypothetical protein
MENEPEQAKPRVLRKAVYAVQVGDKGFRVMKCTNFLELKSGQMLSPSDAQNLIDRGINFTYGPNK